MKEMKIFTVVIFSIAFHHEHFRLGHWAGLLAALLLTLVGLDPLLWTVLKTTGAPGRTRNQKQLPFSPSGGLHAQDLQAAFLQYACQESSN